MRYLKSSHHQYKRICLEFSILSSINCQQPSSVISAHILTLIQLTPLNAKTILIETKILSRYNSHFASQTTKRQSCRERKKIKTQEILQFEAFCLARAYMRESVYVSEDDYLLCFRWLIYVIFRRVSLNTFFDYNTRCLHISQER